MGSSVHIRRDREFANRLFTIGDNEHAFISVPLTAHLLNSVIDSLSLVAEESND